MEYLYPDYYDQFHCIAQDCEDTCCAGWQIVIDKKSLKNYRHIKGRFGNRLYNCINWQEGIFEQNHRKCAFLDENNLCDLYKELGSDALCQTCKRYPRHIEEYENIREITLSLSCPEACRIILGHKKPISFFIRERKGIYEEYESFDFLFFTQLETCREYLLRLIQNRALSIDFRLATALVFTHDLQRRIQKQQFFEIDSVVEHYKNDTMVNDLMKKFIGYKKCEIKKFSWLSETISVFQQLEPLQKQWFETLNTSFMTILSVKETYGQKKQQFRDSYPNLDIELEQIFVTLLYTYFCGAVYDYDVLSKIKFIVISIILIRELDFARWIENKEMFAMADQVDIIHHYSREIEHSDINIERIMKLLKQNTLFHYQQLLYAIFCL